MCEQESSFFNPAAGGRSLNDNAKFDRTRSHTSTIEILRLLFNSLVIAIEVWERFENGEVQYFNTDNQETLQKRWFIYITDIERDANELRSLRTMLRQKIEAYDNMRNGVLGSQYEGSNVVLMLNSLLTPHP